MRVVQVAVSSLVFLLSLEATCRVDDWIRYGTPLWSPVRSEDDLLVHDAAGEHARANTRYQKWVINNVGTRGPDASPTKPANTVRIVTAGASETFGLYESPEHEFPRQLEDSLRAVAETAHCDPHRVEVLNAAIFGMSLPTVEQDLRMRVRALSPDVVVLYPTPVQYLSEGVPHPTPPDSSGDHAHLKASGALHFRAYDRLEATFKGLIPTWLLDRLRRADVARSVRHHPPGWQFTTIPPDRLAAYDTDIRGAIHTIRAIGATPILATHANAFMTPVGRDTVWLASWERQYPRATGDALIAFDSAAAAITLQAAHDSGVAVVDVAAALHVPPHQAFADYAHFTDAGAAAVAHALRPAVVNAAHLDSACAAS